MYQIISDQKALKVKQNEKKDCKYSNCWGRINR